MNEKTEVKQARKRGPKEEAKSVSLQLDDEMRQKLLNIHWLNERNNKGIHIPLSGALRFALHVAHETIFGMDEDVAPEDAVELFKQREQELRAAKAAPRPRPAASPQPEPSGPIDPGADVPERAREPREPSGGSPAELARRKRDSKPDSERGIGKPQPPRSG